MKKYIAIDGPAGAGKSTVAQKLAQSLKISISIPERCIER